MKTFTIREGFSFVMPDNTVKLGGETVDLPDDLADQHRHKFESEPEPEPAPEAKGPAKAQAKAASDPS